jgi:hypothetical protein
MQCRVLVAVLLVVGIFGSGCSDANPAGPTGLTSTDALVTALRAQNATVVRGDLLPQSSNPFFATNAQVISVNAGNVSVFEYASAGAAESDAARVSPDGSTVGSTTISWVGPPHFYRNGRLIVLYAGSSDAVLTPLEAVLGAPFAHG